MQNWNTKNTVVVKLQHTASHLSQLSRPLLTNTIKAGTNNADLDSCKNQQTKKLLWNPENTSFIASICSVKYCFPFQCYGNEYILQSTKIVQIYFQLNFQFHCNCTFTLFKPWGTLQALSKTSHTPGSSFGKFQNHRHPPQGHDPEDHAAAFLLPLPFKESGRPLHELWGRSQTTV